MCSIYISVGIIILSLKNVSFNKRFFKITHARNSRVVQWLGLCPFTAKGEGLIPGRGTKNPRRLEAGSKKKNKQKPILKPYHRPIKSKAQWVGSEQLYFLKVPYISLRCRWC